eukprot:TRINITY_DN2428_c0_g1_i1.p1 TRINITY_DN2428_c0_g1~~TRINITY_DN2428_c0_g1_i1.p1  ORF type:complete len:174 (-),score=33.61 TRINITY_DN2428_c0_g1_i1:577-1098(-)
MGFPGWIFRFLYTKDYFELLDDSLLRPFGPLYAEYKEQDRFFRVVLLSKALLSASIASFLRFYPVVQIILLLVLFSAFSGILIWRRPFKNATFTRMSIAISMLDVVSLGITLGLLDVEPTSEFDGPSIALMCVNTLSTVLLIMLFVKRVLAARTAAKLKQNKSIQELAQMGRA